MTTLHDGRLSKACTLIATAECIETCCHNALSAVTGPHDGSDAWPGPEETHPRMLHFKRRPWNDENPPTAEEIETAKSLVKEAIADLDAWLVELDGGVGS